MVTNGNATVFDESMDVDGNVIDLITNYSDGDSFVNGDSLLFAEGGSANGIDIDVHSQNWALNIANGTQLSFVYEAGLDESVNSVGDEGLAFDVQISEIPEPSCACLLGLGGLSLLVRRRRR